MKIAIIGTGGVALATAAFLNQKGLVPLLVSLTGNGAKALGTADGKATGAIEGNFPLQLALSIEDALRNADHVIVATSADRYLSVLRELQPHVETRHRILVSGELSRFGSVLQRRFAADGKHPTITSLASTLVTGRRGEGAEVRVGVIRPRVLAHVNATGNPTLALNDWNAILGGPLIVCPSPTKLLLSNLNPIVHAPNALCNFTRIEKGEVWSNYGGITAGVAKLLVAVDAERISIGRSFGESLVAYTDNFAKSHDFGTGTPLDGMAQMLCARRGGLPKGPTDVSTRYVTEDIPFGLAVLERLGVLREIETPITTSIVTVFSVLYERDFRSENPFLSDLEDTFAL